MRTKKHIGIKPHIFFGGTYWYCTSQQGALYGFGDSKESSYSHWEYMFKRERWRNAIQPMQFKEIRK